MVKALIVDDDVISSDLVKLYSSKTGIVDVKGVVRNGLEATSFLANNDIDLLFLDIEMPEMDGVELLQSLHLPPKVIFVTSKAEYGPTAYEFNIVDYLLKPVEYPRFLKAINKAYEELKPYKSTELLSGHDCLFIKVNNKSIRLAFKDILYIEALADYVLFCTLDKKNIVHATMKSLESKLPSDVFMRIHRSYFVNMSKIEEIEDHNILIHGTRIPISNTYKEVLMDKLPFL